MDARHSLGYHKAWLAQARVRQQLLPHWYSRFQFGMTRDRQDAKIPLPPYVNSNQLWLLRWENRHDYALVTDGQAGISLNWGIDLQQQHGWAFSRFGERSATLNSSGVFGQLQTDWKDWRFGADIRWDQHGQFGRKVLFSAKLLWQFNKDWLFWVDVGTGYRPPAVNERLNPLFGRADLRPESATHMEIGGHWRPNADTWFDLNLSQRDYRQLIVLRFDIGNGNVRSANIPQAEIFMLELAWRQRWSEAWQSGLNYTYMDARNPLTGRYLPFRAEHQGRLWLAWQASTHLNLRLELNVRDRLWFDQANVLHNTPAARLNLAANYRLRANVDLYARGENLNSERSMEINDFGYPGPTFWGGVKVQF